VLGIGFLFAYARPLAFGAGFATFVAAAVAVRLPTTVPAAVGAVRRIDVDLVTVALSLGAGRRRALSRVLFPLLTPVTVSLLVFLFVRTLVTVSVLLPLAGPRPALASVAAIDASLAGRPAEACALAVMLSVVVLVIVGLRRVLAGREHAAVWFV
jgi:iron(III) transport system permease protein